MRYLLDPTVEGVADRVTLAALLGAVLIALIGAFAAEEPVALQFTERGYSTFVPAVAAALIYPAVIFFLRAGSTRSGHPFFRWLARALIVALVIFEAAAFIHAS